jgi:orotidine-5'-phosphate decarboxylase
MERPLPTADQSDIQTRMSLHSPVTAADRLIVALDVPTVDEALRAVDTLDNVSFFKIGLQLFVTGGLPTLLASLREKRVFVDLKLPGDISNTIASVIDVFVNAKVTFVTLSESMPLPAIRAARAARDAHSSASPKLLTVPVLSSLDASDVPALAGASDVETYILRKAHAAIAAGCDGIIASGAAIRICREGLPHAIIVSPGIRPAGATTDDHKRHTTPTEACRLGADYLVVGRPILKSPSPRDAADRIIEEIAHALP